MTHSLVQPLKVHGGKHYLAPQIVRLMPPHVTYIEPFFGGGAVLLAKDPDGIAEIANDLNGDLTTFWSVLRDEAAFAALIRRAEATPFCEAAWEEADKLLATSRDPTARAWAFFVRCRQSLAGRMKDFATFSTTRTRRRMGEQASAWLTAIEGLSAVHDRMKRVQIANRPAVDVIRQHDGPATLTYADPPYLHETRTAPKAYGAFEMTPADHEELLGVLLRCRGKVLLSGYRNGLYDNVLHDWTRHEFTLPNNAAGGKAKRTMVECVWCNF